MSEDLFKLFDRVKARYDGEGGGGVGCKHPQIHDGVCDVCCERLWYGVVNDEDFYDRTIRRNVNTHNRSGHFYNFLHNRNNLSGEVKYAVHYDFEWFLRAYERSIKKKKLLTQQVGVVAIVGEKGCCGVEVSY